MGITEEQFAWVVGYFEGKGSYCITGSKPNKTFALEVFTVSLWPLRKLQALVGGHIYPTPPAAPSRHTWRLYGRKAEELYSKLRPHLSERLTERGDRKLKICQGEGLKHESAPGSGFPQCKFCSKPLSEWKANEECVGG